MDLSELQETQYYYNDATSLIFNVLQSIHVTGTRPVIIDFMNYVRRYKIDTRDNLYDACVRVINVVEKKHKKNERKCSKVIDDTRASNFNHGYVKILVHKNHEGIDLNENDVKSMERVTHDDHSTIIVYTMWGGIKKMPNETFKDMKKRYKKTDMRGYAMYSRDDCVMNTLYLWLDRYMYNPLMCSNDTFKDSGKYKYLYPFHVYLIIKGESYSFLFDYSTLQHDELTDASSN